jgi:hypothetical protein
MQIMVSCAKFCEQISVQYSEQKDIESQQETQKKTFCGRIYESLDDIAGTAIISSLALGIFGFFLLYFGESPAADVGYVMFCTLTPMSLIGGIVHGCYKEITEQSDK